MGRVTTEATILNLNDILEAAQGKLAEDQIRKVVVPSALVDTGAWSLSLPTSLIRQLGLIKLATKQVMTSKGPSTSDVYAVARLTIQGRDCSLDVMEVPDGVPVLIGQIPLELLDFVVDPKNQRLIVNTDHGGEHIIEMY